jgi:DNA-binding beta-propeller fold protein YncE
VAVLVLAAVLPLWASATAPSVWAAPAWHAPTIQRIIGGPSLPGVSAWGLAYDPVTNQLLVGDYVANQVRKFDLAGSYLGDFTNPGGNVGGTGSALAVDPRDGSSYLAVTGDGKTSKSVRKYDPQGHFMYDFDLSGSVTWLAVDSKGNLFSPEAFGGTRIHEWRVNDATKSVSSVMTFGSAGTGPGQLGRLTGIAVSANGNIFVADVSNGCIHVFSSIGAWLFDIGDKKMFPGDIRGVAVNDSLGRLYVANSQLGTIDVFDLSGNELFSFGSLGEGPGQFADGARELAITPDGDVWAADYADRRVEEFTADGSYLGDFPEPPQDPDPAGLANPHGVAIDPANGDVLVADNWNQRIQRFAPDGTLLQVYGHRGTFLPDGMNYPRSIAVDPATGNVWVANYEGNPDLVVYTSDLSKVVMQIHVPRFINDMDLVGGVAYLVDRRPGSVMTYDVSTGALLSTCCSRLGYLRGIAVDPVNGDMWLTSDTSQSLYIVSPSGSVIKTLSVDGRAWGVTIVGDVVYVADSKANEVIAYDRNTYARLGSFGSKGNLPGQLSAPAGITSDASGDLYVVENMGQRIDVFVPAPGIAPESVPPTITMAAPGTAAPLTATGTASDASGILQVEVMVKDPATGLCWKAGTGTWGSCTWNHAIVWGPSTTASWRFTTVPSLPGHTYVVRARAYDLFGNISRVVARTVTLG